MKEQCKNIRLSRHTCWWSSRMEKPCGRLLRSRWMMMMTSRVYFQIQRWHIPTITKLKYPSPPRFTRDFTKTDLKKCHKSYVQNYFNRNSVGVQLESRFLRSYKHCKFDQFVHVSMAVRRMRVWNNHVIRKRRNVGWDYITSSSGVQPCTPLELMLNEFCLKYVVCNAPLRKLVDVAKTDLGFSYLL